MCDDIKPGTTFLYVKDQDGNTFQLNAKSEPIEWPSTKKEDSEPKTFTATVSFKLGADLVRKMNEYLKRAGFKSKKDYLLFKKNRKRLKKEVHRINNIKGFDNPRKLKSLDWIQKSLKKKTLICIKTESVIYDQSK